METLRRVQQETDERERRQAAEKTERERKEAEEREARREAFLAGPIVHEPGPGDGATSRASVSRRWCQRFQLDFGDIGDGQNNSCCRNRSLLDSVAGGEKFPHLGYECHRI